MAGKLKSVTMSRSQIEALEQEDQEARHSELLEAIASLSSDIKIPDLTPLVADTNRLLKEVVGKANLSKSDMEELKKHITEISKADANRVIMAIDRMTVAINKKPTSLTVQYNTIGKVSGVTPVYGKGN